MSEDSDDFDISDGEIDNKKHEKLIEDVLNLNKNQNVKKPSRTEPTSHISEFNLVKSLSENKNLVHVSDLTKLLKGQKKHVEISNKVKSTSAKSKTLPTPLEKPQADLIRRTLNYEKSRLQLDRWEALVASNRAATNLVFPLGSVEKVKIEEKRAELYPSTWRIKSDLQKELEKLDPKVEEFHIETKKEDQYPLTIDELNERRKEAAKLRAHQGFKEAKARRQNKIKSKKYHRILKREKIKQQLKEFEKLQKTNPEEALKKLDDIEKARAEERFSLRHKGTGQWAKNKQVRAKYDKESRKVLAQQLAISRELTQKVKSLGSDSEDEGIGSEESALQRQNDENNPWVNNIKPGTEVMDFVSGYKKFWNEQNKQSENSEDSEKKSDSTNTTLNKNIVENKTTNVTKNSPKSKTRNHKLKNNKKANDITICTPADDFNLSGMNSSFSTSEWKVTSITQDSSEKNADVEDVFELLEDKLENKLKQKSKSLQGNQKTDKRKQKSKVNSKKYKVDLNFPTKAKRPVIDESMKEQSGDVDDNTSVEMNSDLRALKDILESKEKEEIEQTPNINPNEYIQQKKTTNLNTEIPDILTVDENEEPTDQRELILEAFEDDDIAVDFEKEKMKEIDKDTPKDIDLNLPGWGSWAGGNIDPNKRKRKRFIFKVPAKMPRKDDNKGSLIINEKAQSKIKPLLVSEVPFPFQSVKDYEASIRAPIGNTFVPETAFRKLIEPAVTTKMGAIIEPVDRSILCGIKKF